jgi:hypothetical protein
LKGTALDVTGSQPAFAARFSAFLPLCAPYQWGAKPSRGLVLLNRRDRVAFFAGFFGNFSAATLTKKEARKVCGKEVSG